MNEAQRNPTPEQRIPVDEVLTTKQLKAIPIILAARTYEEGCKAAEVNKTTFYAWMQNETFKAEFERQRTELVDTAFSQIAQNIERAVSTLVGLLDATDDRLRQLAANDVIGHFLKHRELAEFEERIAAIERRLDRK